MHLKILGCGTILQKDTFVNCSGYLIDQQLLFDCGPGIWKAMYQYNIKIDKITHIFFSHFHVDHTSDLAPLLLNRYLTPDLKNIPLKILGPQGLMNWYNHIKKLLGGWSEDLYIELIEIGDKPYKTNDYIIKAHSTGHTENSVCYRIEQDEKSFFYSGDTGMSDNVISLATDSTLAVIEASNTTKTHIPEHLTPTLAGRIAEEAGVQNLILTHMYPETLAGNPKKDASKEFSGRIIIAEEGKSIQF
jgi:ribonuclease BN (tRNA processing enzyme)